MPLKMDPDPDLNPDLDLDPPIFVFDLQDADKKLPVIFKKNLYCFLLFKVHLHHLSKIKSQKDSRKSRLFLLFC
jgi:hypothetical protein